MLHTRFGKGSKYIIEWQYPLATRARFCTSVVLRFTCQREEEKVFEENTAVARFVLMLPAGAALVPIFEGFLEVELYGVDELTFVAFHHHLVTAKI